MRLPQTLPNIKGCDTETHTLALPQCCPTSGNPFEGSTIMIHYHPGPQVLEIGSLYAYIDQYKGGLKNDAGKIIVRDMEQMIATIAQHCAEAAGVPIGVCANLVLKPEQTMYLMVRRKAESEARL